MWIELAPGPAGAAERIGRASFQARACSAVIALASLSVEGLAGLDAAGLAALDPAVLAERAGGLPRTRRHAVLVVRRALAEVGAAWGGAARLGRTEDSGRI